MAGWIKIYRTILEKGWITKPEYVALWVYLLLQASHKNREQFWNGKTITLLPGQFITGRLKIGADTGIHESKVERILKCFESEQQIEQRKTSTSRLISICNWNKFQDAEQPFEQRVNNDCTTSEQRVNTKQELKKERIKETNTKVFVPPTEIEIEDYILKDLQNVPIESIKNFSAEIFDYYTSKGWLVGKSKMKDWKAAVRNWIRNDKKFKDQKNGTSNPSNPTTKEPRIGRMAKRDVEEFFSRPIIDNILGGPNSSS